MQTAILVINYVLVTKKYLYDGKLKKAKRTLLRFPAKTLSAFMFLFRFALRGVHIARSYRTRLIRHKN